MCDVCNHYYVFVRYVCLHHAHIPGTLKALVSLSSRSMVYSIFVVSIPHCRFSRELATVLSLML